MRLPFTGFVRLAPTDIPARVISFSNCPFLEAGLADHIWKLEEVVNIID